MLDINSIPKHERNATAAKLLIEAGQSGSVVKVLFQDGNILSVNNKPYCLNRNNKFILKELLTGQLGQVAKSKTSQGITSIDFFIANGLIVGNSLQEHAMGKSFKRAFGKVIPKERRF